MNVIASVCLATALVIGPSSPARHHDLPAITDRFAVAQPLVPIPASSHGGEQHDEGDHGEGQHDDSGHAASAEPLWHHAIRFLGNFHPALVHLPIGLIAGAAIAETLAGRRRRAPFAAGSVSCAFIGGFGAIIAACFGWADWLHARVDSDAAWALTVHQVAGTAAAVIAIPLLVVTRRLMTSPSPGARRAYLALLALDLACVGGAGYFGGELIYGIGHLAW